MFTARHKRKNILIYADSERSADILYATRLPAPDPFIFIRTAAGRRHVVMSDLEIDRARANATVDSVHSLTKYAALAKTRFNGTPNTAEILATILKSFSIRSVAVPSAFPLGIADQMRKLGIGVTPLPDPFFPERIYKRPEEIAEIRKAFRATEKAIHKGLDVLRASRITNGYLMYRGRKLTVETLRSVIDTTCLTQGYVPTGSIIAPGKQGCDPHDRGSGLIRANEPIIIDVFPRSEKTGYFADMTRTVVRGKASETIRRMYGAVHAGQRLGLSMIKHGVKARNVHAAINALFEERGFLTGEKNGRMQGFFHTTGHALGLEIHEPPRIAYNNVTLETGMVLTVEPGLYYYPHGGVRIEDTVLVTRKGIENLTRFPKFLEL